MGSSLFCLKEYMRLIGTQKACEKGNSGRVWPEQKHRSCYQTRISYGLPEKSLILLKGMQGFTMISCPVVSLFTLCLVLWAQEAMVLLTSVPLLYTLLSCLLPKLPKVLYFLRD